MTYSDFIMSRNIQTFIHLYFCTNKYKVILQVGVSGRSQGVFDDQALRAVLRPLLQGPSAEEPHFRLSWVLGTSKAKRRQKGGNFNSPF